MPVLSEHICFHAVVKTDDTVAAAAASRDLCVDSVQCARSPSTIDWSTDSLLGHSTMYTVLSSQLLVFLPYSTISPWGEGRGAIHGEGVGDSEALSTELATF